MERLQTDSLAEWWPGRMMAWWTGILEVVHQSVHSGHGGAVQEKNVHFFLQF